MLCVFIMMQVIHNHSSKAIHLLHQALIHSRVILLLHLDLTHNKAIPLQACEFLSILNIAAHRDHTTNV